MWRDSARTKFDGTWDVEVEHDGDGPNCAGHEREYYPIIISPDHPQLPLNPATGKVSGYYPMLPDQRPIQLYDGKLNETRGSGKWYNSNTGCSGTWAATKRQESAQARTASQINPSRLRVFVASPGDVAEERKILENVIKEINLTLSGNQIHLELIWFPHEASPLAR